MDFCLGWYTSRRLRRTHPNNDYDRETLGTYYVASSKLCLAKIPGTATRRLEGKDVEYERVEDGDAERCWASLEPPCIAVCPLFW